ncbi:uncharacterized protein [Procambarus clarkii]|uniref:uncharacterized protein isoform X1 n=1 Tax=Procambarus clarkii TaxID=6728 RepID=UPI003743FC2D
MSIPDLYCLRIRSRRISGCRSRAHPSPACLLQRRRSQLCRVLATGMWRMWEAFDQPPTSCPVDGAISPQPNSCETCMCLQGKFMRRCTNCTQCVHVRSNVCKFCQCDFRNSRELMKKEEESCFLLKGKKALERNTASRVLQRIENQLIYLRGCEYESIVIYYKKRTSTGDTWYPTKKHNTRRGQEDLHH